MAGADAVRYGVIGTGMMGREHIANLLHLDGAAVTAIADPHEPSLDRAEQALGDRADDARRFTSHTDLLASGLCDAVVVASPNHTHAQILLDVMSSGLHVLVEKPLCTTVEDCLRVIEASRRRSPGSIVWVGLEYRYMAPVARLIDEVAAGAVGRLRMLAIREHRFPFLRKVGDWNRFNENTGGTLVEKCCHFFDLMNVIVGSRPRRVLGSGGQDVNHLDESYDGRRPDILDNAYVIAEYDGVRAMLDLCMFAEATREQEEIVAVGDAGKVEAFVPSGIVRVGRRGTHFIGKVDESVATGEQAAYEGFHHGSSFLEHKAFLDAIRSGSDRAAVSLEDGMWSVAMGAAAQLSIEQARPVDLDEVIRPV